MEKSHQESPNPLELAKQEIQQKIKYAREHALDVENEGDFIQKFSDLSDKEQRPDPISEDDERELKTMEKRVKKAMAEVATLQEFSMLLQNIQDLTPAQVIDLIEHENAHANKLVQQNATTVFHGYGVIFFKQDGHIISVQPTTVSEQKTGSEKIDFIKDSIESLNAPNEYGHKNSDDDEREIAKLTHLLQIHTEHQTSKNNKKIDDTKKAINAFDQ